MAESQCLEDWHHADIIAALHKRNITLSGLSRASGLSSTTLSNALTRPWPKGELIIAHALGIHPSEIWPSRYFDIRTHQLIDRQQLMRQRKPKKIKPPAIKPGG
ncbi:helix-turn-helix transcriptional regulator [Hafnia alvei]|uniref:Transcriptional regulator, Nlp family n=1 Tax=Hafnia alvei TaxID=569 RepID=A0A1C6YXB6_HAFAL|nr:helix-turn-helix transcriptional regulator [Hafnia alvei]NLS54359.1 transcriptional regulator [Hafnia alvei]SCM51537.1 transcriptional regulator, Nlp family [Hafnia alvei]